MRCARCIKGCESPVKTPATTGNRVGRRGRPAERLAAMKNGGKRDKTEGRRGPNDGVDDEMGDNSRNDDIHNRNSNGSVGAELRLMDEESPMKRAQRQKERLKALQRCRMERGDGHVPQVDLDMFHQAQAKVS